MDNFWLGDLYTLYFQENGISKVCKRRYI